MIAMALALEPRIVIMDEPTTALDVVTQREILEELAELRKRLGFAVLFITHDLSLLLEIADSISIMYSGHIVEQASAPELFRAPAPLHAGPARLVPVAARSPGDDDRHRRRPARPAPPAAGCPFHPRCSYAMDVCRERIPQLRTPWRDETSDRVVSCWLHDPVASSLSLPPALAAEHSMGGSR